MPKDSQPRTRSATQQLKRAAFVLVAVAIAALTGTGSIQVISQALYPNTETTSLSCRSGTRSLFAATERARLRVPAGENITERHALATFRSALMPEWGAEGALMKSCMTEGDPEALRAFRAVRFLRYAEERHVRTESLDLARKRSVTPALVRALDPTPLNPAP